VFPTKPRIDFSSVVEKFTGLAESFHREELVGALRDLGAFSISFRSSVKFVKSVTSGPNVKVAYLGIFHDALAFWHYPSKVIPLLLQLGPV